MYLAWKYATQLLYSVIASVHCFFNVELVLFCCIVVVPFKHPPVDFSSSYRQSLNWFTEVGLDLTT